ncbi:MAG: pseudouridine-5'-phosphate glycosidase [Candidatus Cloacimonetes bacterium]|nr:pseudouridine-5'-phosphate glycosidase [Candidatus Cloacimonadota bacterium]
MVTETLRVHPEVAAALREHRPVVALESTLISHGLPWPDNRDTALRLESIVREEGAVPATICLANGHVHVGLDSNLLNDLASGGAQKVSMRNLSLALANRSLGATTVAATMWCAHRAGIEVFATGGIGGVHRGAPFDVSADLLQMSRTPVMIISAGAKAVLDLPATLEVLETHGVPVVGLRTDVFPAFWSAASGLPVPRLDSEAEVAALWHTHRNLGLSQALLVGNPIPREHEIPAATIEGWLREAERDPALPSGPALTPWLLRRLAEISSGRTLQANLRLLENNARVAARVAVALFK